MGDHLKLVEAFRPDAFECLCDSSPSVGNKPKRVRKSVDRTLRFLDETVEARAGRKVGTSLLLLSLAARSSLCTCSLMDVGSASKGMFLSNQFLYSNCVPVAFLLRVACLCALRHCRVAACWGPLKAAICWRREGDQLLRLR